MGNTEHREIIPYISKERLTEYIDALQNRDLDSFENFYIGSPEEDCKASERKAITIVFKRGAENSLINGTDLESEILSVHEDLFEE